MSLITPPDSQYFDQYDRSRFNLVWTISLGVLVLLSILTILNFNQLNKASIPNFIAMIICVILLIFLKTTHKYVLVSKIASISSCLLVSNTFFFVTDVIHYNTPMWMLLNILFTFFTLGKVWGIVISVIHFIALATYVAIGLESNIQRIDSFDFNQKVQLVLETLIVAIGLLYVILQFLRYNKIAENTLKESNESLSEQNKIISIQNQEKNVMLKEIHHRVKNNLQVITSLLRLQSYELEDVEHSKPFLEAINRVKSMALIHEKMYQSKVLSTFNFEDYFRSLASELIQAYSFNTQITLKIESEMHHIANENIVPISLLFNELISNSIKHAFHSNPTPVISINIIKIPSNGNYEIYYSDNGQWKESNQRSFGTELINTMTEQLNGQLTLTKDENGTHYVFYFENLEE